MSLSCETKELNMTEESLPTLFRLWLIDTRELFKTYIEKIHKTIDNIIGNLL